MLFTPTFDATVLDERVIISCSRPWSYSLSQNPEHQDALTFYSTKWGSQKFHEVLSGSRDFVCWGNFYYEFIKLATKAQAMFIIFLPFTYLMKSYFLRKNKRPLKYLFCSETFLFHFINYTELIWFFIFLYPSAIAAGNKLTNNIASVKEFFNFQSTSPIV